MTDYRYFINTTKAAMAAYPKANVITDSHRPAVKGEASVNGETVVALCPITRGDTPTCDGQFSFAHVVQKALEAQNALPPFVRLAAEIPDNWPDSQVIWKFNDVQLTVGDFRALARGAR